MRRKKPEDARTPADQNVLRRGLAPAGAGVVLRTLSGGPLRERVDGLCGRNQCHRPRSVLLATIAKFLDWFVHSDPKTMVRTTRWMLLLLVLACIPLLVVMIANQQWPAAMLIGAGMLIATLLKWRAIFAPLRAAFGYFRPKPRPFDMEIWDDEAARDPEMVRRAAAILEAYLGKSSLVALSDGRRGAVTTRAPVAPGSPRRAGPREGRRRGGDPRRPQAPARARPSRSQRLG